MCINKQKVCSNCSQPFTYKSSKAMFCGTVCKQANLRKIKKASTPQLKKQCLYCSVDFYPEKKSGLFCCLRCQQLNMRKNKFVEEDGMVSCCICGLKAHCLVKHLNKIHNLSPDEYRTTHNSPVRSKSYQKDQSERIKGSKNPAYQHGGKFSPLSDKFIHASTTNKTDIITKISKSNKENGNNDATMAYWLKQGYSTSEAKKKLSERQITFSLDKCIQKYGHSEGTKVWNERQDKWLNNYKKTNFSKVSQTLFWKIYNILSDKTNIYFATLLDGVNDDSGKNHEYTLKTTQISLKPDFYISTTKSIIEFDGDYWHGTKRGNQQRDANRDSILISEGFRVLHIRERDYEENSEKTVKKCLEFING